MFLPKNRHKPSTKWFMVKGERLRVNTKVTKIKLRQCFFA